MPTASGNSRVHKVIKQPQSVLVKMPSNPMDSSLLSIISKQSKNGGGDIDIFLRTTRASIDYVDHDRFSVCRVGDRGGEWDMALYARRAVAVGQAVSAEGDGPNRRFDGGLEDAGIGKYGAAWRERTAYRVTVHIFTCTGPAIV